MGFAALIRDRVGKSSTYKARAALAAAVLVAGSFLLPNTAHALPILQFGQISGTNTVVGTDNNNGTTTISTKNTLVSITQIDSPFFPSPTVPPAAFLTFNLTSTNAAVSFGTSIVQDFSGTFSITGLADGLGTNYLTGSFIDVAFGSGKSFTLSATTPPAGNVIFNSGVIFDLGYERGAGLTFVNVTPSLSIDTLHVRPTISTFSASVTGNFSAEPISTPEPVSLALLATGLIGVGMTRRRHRS